MGDISGEPSMEDILSSIKRIIAEEGDGSIGGRTGRRSSATTDNGHAADPSDDSVLELRERVDMERGGSRPEESAVEPENKQEVSHAGVEAGGTFAQDEPGKSGSDFEAAETRQREMEAMLSARAAEASRGSLEALSRLIIKPQTAGAETLEGLVREMLRPMLSDWLDANLPQIVETMVAREIARITRSSD